MSNESPNKKCGSSRSCSCARTSRREFLGLVGIAAASSVLGGGRAIAGPFTAEDFQDLVPRDKKLDPAWLKSLPERGGTDIYRGADIQKIGMPVGGIGAGHMYLGGDGKLWHWDIFNQQIGTGAEHYASPLVPGAPVDQGFAIRYTAEGRTQVRSLDRRGFEGVSFRGEYPVGRVEYSDPSAPVRVTLEAFSPFIPLNPEDSGLPVTILQFTVRNVGGTQLSVDLAGWLENAVCLHSGTVRLLERRNSIGRAGSALVLECSAQSPSIQGRRTPRPDIVFEDFEKPTYEGWTATGTAFGAGPVEKSKMPQYQGDVGAEGDRLVNTHNTRQGEDVGKGDAHTGTLVSKPFKIERDYINLLIGGGSHEGKTCVNIIVDGKVFRSLTGRSDNRMLPYSVRVADLEGKEARIEIVDRETGPWGNIGVDQIVFSDAPRVASGDLPDQPDFGALALALLETSPKDRGTARLPEGDSSAVVFDAPEKGEATGSSLRGAVARALTLRAGAAETVTFLVAWYMPNLRLDGLKDIGGRFYATRFRSVKEVVRYVAENLGRLAGETRLWRDTWYDSTLPYWFLDRTFANTSTLATSTCHWLASGRFYGWEGVGCCQGTCTHVWHYAQAVGRIFPQIERDIRERVDYGIAFDPKSGVINFRGEWASLAVDGQAGTILRTYREHQMSPDDRFLRRVWPRVRRAMECLLAKDADGDGLLDGNQHNTLDADWFGQVSWLSSLYLAALRAAEEMAREVSDEIFEARARQAFETGAKSLPAKLFNGEYFIHKGDPDHADVVGAYDGCLIDQVFGQCWAYHVDLGRVLPSGQTLSALEAIWRYNFTPDVGPYRKAHEAGRWYAMPGEGGVLMATFPKGPPQAFRDRPGSGAGFAMYFNECMTGFEHQVASHMMWEGLVEKALVIERTIHDRYHPSRRNPWNEVECGDHYARAMASYGVFLAACGYEHHGPRGHIGFAPRISPEEFKAPFTAAEGWGTFSQEKRGSRQIAAIMVRWGRLRVETISLQVLPGVRTTEARVLAGGKEIPARRSVDGLRVTLTLGEPVEIRAGEKLEIALGG